MLNGPLERDELSGDLLMTVLVLYPRHDPFHLDHSAAPTDGYPKTPELGSI